MKQETTGKIIDMLETRKMDNNKEGLRKALS